MTSLTAQMSRHGGRWRLYIVDGAPDWPTFRWERSGPVPTVAQRRSALGHLGYEMVPGAEWSWIEDSDNPDDDSTPVLLIADVTVRPRQGVPA